MLSYLRLGVGLVAPSLSCLGGSVWSAASQANPDDKLLPELVRRISVPNAGNRVAISRDGKVLAALVLIREGENHYNRIRLIRVADGSLVRELSEPVGLIGPMEFSPDGRYLAAGSVSGSDRALQMWRVADGHLSFRMPAIVV